MYEITDYTKQKAKDLGLIVVPSKNPKKKIDVIKNNEKIASIGALGMGDFPTYKKQKGIKYANERRRLYNLRHKNDKGVAGRLAKELLW
jgi:hypothetical protein